MSGVGGRWIDENRPFREVQLSSPVRFDGRDINLLRIRQPVVADVEEIPAASFEKPVLFLREVLAACAGVNATTIRLLTVEDFVRCTEALTQLGFRLEQAYGLLASQMQSVLATGPTGSESSPPASGSGSESSG